MDDYGIAASALAGLTVYEGAARASGRTTRLVRELVEDSIVLCLSGSYRTHLEDMIKRHRPDLTRVRIISLPKSRKILPDFVNYEIRQAFASRGRVPVFFSHELVLELYENAVRSTSDFLTEYAVRAESLRSNSPPYDVLPTSWFDCRPAVRNKKEFDELYLTEFPTHTEDYVGPQKTPKKRDTKPRRFR